MSFARQQQSWVLRRNRRAYGGLMKSKIVFVSLSVLSLFACRSDLDFGSSSPAVQHTNQPLDDGLPGRACDELRFDDGNLLDVLSLVHGPAQSGDYSAQFRLAQGQRLTFAFGDNPTTGYSW